MHRIFQKVIFTFRLHSTILKIFSAVSKNLKFFSQKVLILGRSPARRTAQRDMKKLGLCFWMYLNVRWKFIFMGLSKREIWTVLSCNVHKCEYTYCGLLLQSLFITFIDVYMNEHYHRFSEHTMKFIFMEYPHSWNKITTYCSLKPSGKVITRNLFSVFEILEEEDFKALQSCKFWKEIQNCESNMAESFQNCSRWAFWIRTKHTSNGPMCTLSLIVTPPTHLEQQFWGMA